MKNSGRKVRVGLTIGFCLVAACAVWWFWLRSPGPDEIAQMTARALTRGDIDTLLHLTMPEEVQKLHLTKEGVRGMLSQTLYADGIPRELRVSLEGDIPVDQRQYYLKSPNGKTASVTYPLIIMVNEQPNGRWYLALGYVLLNSCSLKDKQMTVPDRWERFWDLSNQYKINGIRLNTIGYACKNHLCD